MIFRPRWLYIKQHNITGLKYFGQTTKEPEKYSGSGLYWKQHIKKHGKSVSTLWKLYFEDEEEIKEFSLFFSEFYNIVDSDSWANLMVENGLDGSEPGRKLRKPRSEEYCQKLKLARNLRGPISEETRHKMSVAKLGKPGPIITEAHKQAISKLNSGKKRTEEQRANISRGCKGKMHSQAHLDAYEKSKGSSWYNDGIFSYMVKKTETPDLSWTKGRLKGDR